MARRGKKIPVRPATFFEILTALIRAIRERYNRDPTAPSVILSEIGASGEYYTSVVCYHAGFAQQKEIVVSVKAKTLPEAVQELSKKWLQIGKAEATLARCVEEECVEEEGKWGRD